MSLNLKGLAFVTLLLGASASFAEVAHTEEFYQIHSVQIEEVTDEAMVYERDTKYQSDVKGGMVLPTGPGENVGRIIAIGKDIVALGESIYRLVNQGRPTNQTTYAPISVIPRVNGEPADIFETENWSAPVKRTYQIKYNNLYDVTIVHFMFSVMYSYGGSYNNKGAYLTSVQVVPEYVKTLWGWEFSATMKLGGIQNVGTKANPIAGATVMIEYSAGSILNVIQRTTSFFITGKGSLKQL